MKRTPLHRRTELRRTGSPKRWARLKAVNRKRAKAKYIRNFGPHAALIRARPCDGCGMPAPSDSAHTVARKMGGCHGSAKDLVSLCGDRYLRPGCHFLYDNDIKAFTARTGKTKAGMIALAAELWLLSHTDPEEP